MAQGINRVHEALAAWKRMEENNVNMFPPSVMGSSEFAKVRLKRLEEVAAKLSFTSVQEEKDSLNILAIERKMLLKTVYPEGQGLRRFLFKYILQPLKFQMTKQAELRKNNLMLAKIQDTMLKGGFSEHVSQVFKRIKQGERDFSLPVPLRVRQNDQVAFTLKFNYDDQKGHSFDSYQVNYRNNLKHGAPRKQSFNMREDVVHCKKAENLIAGRAILETTYQNGTPSQRWVKLDTVKNDEGNYLMKYLPGDSFDVKKACEDLPSWNSLNSYDQLLVVGNLISGNRPAIAIDYLGKPLWVALECDPETRLIQAFDLKGGRVDLKKVEPKSVKTSLMDYLNKQTAQNAATIPMAKQKKAQKVIPTEEKKQQQRTGITANAQTEKIKVGIAAAKQRSMKNQPPAKAARKNKKARIKFSS